MKPVYIVAMKNSPLNRISPQRGVGLIEVMVAILLLAMGLLGAIALQFATAKEQRSSQFVSRAAVVANEMAERMRTNRAGLALGMYVTEKTNYADAKAVITSNTSSLNACVGAQAECAQAALAEQTDMLAWWAVIRSGLPQASAHIVLTPEGAGSLRRDIIVAWVEPVVDKDASGTAKLLVSNSAASGCPTGANKIDAPDGVRCYQMRFIL